MRSADQRFLLLLKIIALANLCRPSSLSGGASLESRCLPACRRRFRRGQSAARGEFCRRLSLSPSPLQAVLGVGQRILFRRRCYIVCLVVLAVPHSRRAVDVVLASVSRRGFLAGTGSWRAVSDRAVLTIYLFFRKSGSCDRRGARWPRHDRQSSWRVGFGASSAIFLGWGARARRCSASW